jgi:glycosidase
MIPHNKQQVVFIENHDMQRFASTVNKNVQKEKIGAALNLLVGGVPSIYYGQELGMSGRNAGGKYGMTDANDIPIREAFEWYAADSGKGMALWYRNTGPWWTETNLKPNDGISLEEERKDPNSLFNFYKQVIHLRQSTSALISGKYQTLHNDNGNILSFSRGQSAVVVINLSDKSQRATVDLPKLQKPIIGVVHLLGQETGKVSGQQYVVTLPAYSIDVWGLR